MLNKLFLIMLSLIVISGMVGISGCIDSNNTTTTPQKTQTSGGNVTVPVITYNDSVIAGQSTGNITLNHNDSVRINIKKDQLANDNDLVNILIAHIDNHSTRIDVKGAQYKLNDWSTNVSNVKTIEIFNNGQRSIYVTVEPL